MSDGPTAMMDEISAVYKAAVLVSDLFTLGAADSLEARDLQYRVYWRLRTRFDELAVLVRMEMSMADLPQ